MAYKHHLDLYIQEEMKKNPPIMTEESLKSNSKKIQI